MQKKPTHKKFRTIFEVIDWEKRKKDKPKSFRKGLITGKYTQYSVHGQGSISICTKMMSPSQVMNKVKFSVYKEVKCILVEIKENIYNINIIEAKRDLEIEEKIQYNVLFLNYYDTYFLAKVEILMESKSFRILEIDKIENDKIVKIYG